ncbi:MAG: MotA/TolQ/ExbB proton channel family protein [Alphaproteobacteria bacterium]|jgi:biopolymer transport protein ExbB|nr:MotA/TolQ/ExbB proton channel family protein [Alphaproteobacteria bacterium]
MTELGVLASTLDLLAKGGPVMMVLLAVSGLAVLIIVAKLLQFARLGLGNLRFVDPAMTALGRSEPQAALALLAKRRHPVARVMESAITTSTDSRLTAEDRDAEISRVGSAQIRDLESHLHALEVIANLSPLLGLLGTVIGMIGAFAKLEDAGSKVDPAMLAGGIWEALLTTAFGLVIAIPALAAFYVLEGRVETVRALMKDAVTRILGSTVARR